jgi:hypothetical protein
MFSFSITIFQVFLNISQHSKWPKREEKSLSSQTQPSRVRFRTGATSPTATTQFSSAAARHERHGQFEKKSSAAAFQPSEDFEDPEQQDQFEQPEAFEQPEEFDEQNQDQQPQQLEQVGAGHLIGEFRCVREDCSFKSKYHDSLLRHCRQVHKMTEDDPDYPKNSR